jgi:hypothetical protein
VKREKRAAPMTQMKAVVRELPGNVDGNASCARKRTHDLLIKVKALPFVQGADMKSAAGGGGGDE